MACTKFSLEQYQALNEAIAMGAMKVVYGDKTVEYKSTSDMLRVQLLMEKCLFPQNFKNGGRTFASFSKGTVPPGRRC